MTSLQIYDNLRSHHLILRPLKIEHCFLLCTYHLAIHKIVSELCNAQTLVAACIDLKGKRDREVRPLYL